MSLWIDVCGTALPRRSVAAGERIFTRGDADEVMYVVLDGEIELVAAGVVLERVGPGAIFGELALIDGGTRSASARALVLSELVVINREAFVTLVRDRPELALDVMQTLTARLRRSTEYL